MLTSEKKSKKIIKAIMSKKRHDSCFDIILQIERLDEQRNMYKNKKQFFPLSQNRYIHIPCNKLDYEGLQRLKDRQVDQLKNVILEMLKNIKHFNLIINFEKLTILRNLIDKDFDVKNNEKISLICHLCRQTIFSDNVQSHYVKCNKNKSCTFFHIDGHQCDYNNHSKKIHLNFISIDFIKDISYNKDFDKKAIKYFSPENLSRNNEIFLFKTKRPLKYLVWIINNYKHI